MRATGGPAALIRWPAAIEEQRALAAGAGRCIRDGGLVVYPTDTVYGLGADPANPDAIARMYWAKERPPEKAIVWLISSLERAGQTCEVDSLAEQLAERFWPGPLTLVLRRTNPSAGAPPTQAVRIPAHPAAIAIVEAAGGAVATTSANRSGLPSARTAAEAAQALGATVDLIVDAGPTPGGVESTVLDLTTTPPAILRAGPITAAEIEAAISVPVESRL